MIRPDIEPVYLPHNEPYLGQPHLLAFDEAIAAAMRTNLEVARHTFVKPLSPLQIAASEITPKIQQQMERIQRLPKAQQRIVMQMIDTVLVKQGR